jgi:hypothetical protein
MSPFPHIAINGHIVCPIYGVTGCIWPYLGAQKSVSVFRSFYLNGMLYLWVPGSDTIPRGFTQDQLYTLNEPLCPPMHTFQRLLREKQCHINRTYHFRNTDYPVTEIFAEANADKCLRIDCSGLYYNAYLTAHRLHWIGGGVLAAKLHRSFGLLDSVTDPAWLAQIEIKPTSKHEKED